VSQVSARNSSPLVSVVTPVFNGDQYLRTCIESVLAQTYDHWEYTLVDNCSTDRSLAIAREYAETDPRVNVQSNEQFVGAIENHNRAFRSISPDAKYCKLVSADDWIYPESIAKLVDLAERQPSVGIVGSYASNGSGVRWVNLPLGDEIFAGREVARSYLLGAIDSFFLPSTVLYRASLVSAADAFFPGPALSADLEASLDCFRRSDFGFVHQILAFERIHDQAMTATVRQSNSQLLDRIRILIEFGPEFLTPGERERRLQEQLNEYFDVLAEGCLTLQGGDFWRLHKAGLDELGYSIYDLRLAKAVVAKLLDLVLNPKATTERIVRRAKTSRAGAGPR
jgi:glycosyltransferase involved in cell wall biosynthesis